MRLDLGRSKSKPKTVLLATRVTPKINELINQMAHREGLYVSEWIRTVLIGELKKSGLLTTRLIDPTYNKISDTDIDDL